MNTAIIVEKLTSEFIEKPLYAIWRIIALSEIPETKDLEYTKNVIKYIKSNWFVEEGFSYTGKKDDIVPCYNAMIIEALSKLGEEHSPDVKQAVEWIKKYQFFHRGGTTSWTGKGIHNYGGCLESTPCFIGVSKTLKALLHYRNIAKIDDIEINKIIGEATSYVQQHNFCFRLSNGKPISNHILSPAFPASYVLNIIDMLEIAYLTDSLNDKSATKMIEHLESIKNDNGYWGVGYQYKGDGYISFDGGKKKAEWITHIINSYLS